MKPTAKRFWSILISLVLLVGGMAIFTSLVVPAYREVQELRGEKRALASALKEEEELVAAASRLLSQYESTGDLRRNLSLVLPTGENIPGAVNQLQGIAKVTGVSVEAMNIELLPLQPQKSTIVEPIGGLKISLRLRGSYESLRAYAQAVETNVRVFDVDSFIIGGGATQGPLETNMIIKTYYQR